MQKREINYLCFSLVFCLVCFPSPLMYFIGLDKAVASGLLFILLFWLVFALRRDIPSILIYCSFLFGSSAFLLHLKHQDISTSLFGLQTFLSFGIFSFLTKRERIRIVEWLSFVFGLLLGLAVISFCISFFWEGIEITLTWGRKLVFLFGSLGDFTSISFFRPSSIYDEPGALVMFSTMLCVLRQFYGLDDKVTIIIGAMALVTMSPIAVIYILFFFITNRTYGILVPFLFLNLIIIFDIFILNGYVYETIFSRFLKITDFSASFFYQNNRIEAFFYAVEILENQSLENLIYGQPPICLIDNNCDVKKPDFTFISPLINQGLLNSWFYYLGILLFFYFSLTKKYYLSFLVILLNFAVRPSAHSHGYSMWFSMITLTIIFEIIEGNRENGS